MKELILSGRPKIARDDGVLELAAADLESSPHLELFRRIFGERLNTILADDPQPMIVRAVDLLDKGDIRNGEQTWVVGEYQVWMTAAQFVNEFAVRYRKRPGFMNHRSSNELDLSLWTVELMQLDPQLNVPMAYLYVKPRAEIRRAIRNAAADDTLGVEFPLSLHFWADPDPQTLQLTTWKKESWWSLDAVRRQGTKQARVDKALAASAEEKEMLTFETIADALKHPDIQNAMEVKLASMLKEPARVKEIALAASDDIALAHKAVAPLKERPESREAVVKSLTAKDAEFALACPEFRTEIVKKVQELAAKHEQNVVRLRELMLAEKLGEDVIAMTLGNPGLELSAKDEAGLGDIVKGVKEIMLARGQAAAAQTVKARETVDGSEDKKVSPSVDRKAEREFLRASRGW